jgi:hypothetical protein
MGEMKTAARQAHDSDALDHAIRLGLVAYGVVHVLIGWLALQIAFGDAAQSASSSGAMHALARQPFGAVLLWAVVLGMALLVVWRLLEAWHGHDGEDGKEELGKRAGSLAKAVIYGVLGFTAAQVAVGDSSGGGTDSLTADLMRMPGGQLIVGAVGLAVVAYGVRYVYRGWTEKFLEHLDADGSSGDTGTAYRWIGKAGHIAKGIAVGIVGGLFCWAALTHDPQKSGGLDQALHEIAQQPLGQGLLAAVALGIACFGLFCFARARHLSR